MGEREQPAAEQAELRIERSDRCRHAAQHLLRQVGGVGILQSLAARKAVNDRSIKPNEFAPGAIVLPIAQSHQKARSCRRQVRHRILTRYILGSAEIYRRFLELISLSTEP